VTVPPNTFDLFGAIRKPVPTGNGLRATFTPPPENIAFDILVTFNDGTTHRSPRPHWNTVPGVIQTYRARDNRPMPPLEKPREIFPFRDRP
jgi:hypothetical protein